MALTQSQLDQLWAQSEGVPLEPWVKEAGAESFYGDSFIAPAPTPAPYYGGAQPETMPYTAPPSYSLIPVGTSPPATAGVTEPAALAGVIVISLAFLTRLFGGTLANVIWGTLRRIAFTAGGKVRVVWNSIPAPIRFLLTFAGISAGTEIVLEGATGLDIPGPGNLPFIGPSLPSLPGAPGSNGSGQYLPVQGIPQVAIVGTWVANGITFYRLADGRLAVQNMKGRWKVWRPKKPIVMYASGASNLRTLLRADKAVAGQVKKLKKAISRRTTTTRRKIIDGSGADISITKTEVK